MNIDCKELTFKNNPKTGYFEKQPLIIKELSISTGIEPDTLSALFCLYGGDC